MSGRRAANRSDLQEIPQPVSNRWVVRGFASVLVALAVLGLVPGAGATHRDPPCPSSDGIRIQSFEVPSVHLDPDPRVCILLPDGYPDDGAYPVLYLLHGAGDDQGSWLANTDLEGLRGVREFIVVMPDGGGRHGEAGWYSDWQDGPAWESYHIGELLPWVDEQYATTGDRAGRVIAGLSMGGFGAMSYAARHPDLFSAAGSFSGAVDTTAGGPAEAAAFELAHLPYGTPDHRVWGPYPTHEVHWRNHNPADLVTNLRWTELWFTSGNGVPQLPRDHPAASPAETGVYAMNRSFQERLSEEGVDHVWRDRGHGTHQWHYWEEDLDLFSDREFGGASPEVFDYRSADPSFSVWGWSFEADPARAAEFLELAGVSKGGFTVRGSGELRVRTDGLFAPGDTYDVVQSSDGSVSGTTLVTADADGRLSFPVDLGPPHAHRQYTPLARVAEASDPDYWRTVEVEIRPPS